MTTYLLILIMFAVAFILQIFLTGFQMKGFNLNYARLHRMGRVAIGRSRGGFRGAKHFRGQREEPVRRRRGGQVARFLPVRCP